MSVMAALLSLAFCSLSEKAPLGSLLSGIQAAPRHPSYQEPGPLKEPLQDPFRSGLPPESGLPYHYALMSASHSNHIIKMHCWHLPPVSLEKQLHL
jgi:hypothetical protein